MLELGEERLNLLRGDLEALSNGKLDVPVDSDLSSALRHVNARQDKFRMPLFDVRENAPFSYEVKSDEELLLFSGGKTSLATAIRLRSMHKNVNLLHIEESPELTARCLEMADKLRLPLLIQQTDFNIGNNVYTGMMLAQEAIELAVQNEISPRVYMGYFYMASVTNNPSKDWKYCNEFIGAYNTAVSKYVRGAQIVGLLPSPSVVDDELMRCKEFNKFFA